MKQKTQNKDRHRSAMLHASCFTFHEKGFSLFEILIAIAVFSVVGVSVAQIIGVALQSDKTAGQKTVGLELAQETMGAVNAIVTSQWNDVYNLTEGGGTLYYPANTAALCGSVKWCVQSGSATSSANSLIYTRSFYPDNVSRTGTTTDAIYNAPNDDPSTQKVTVTVTWAATGGGAQLGSVSVSNYFTRARNAVAVQTRWDDSPAGTAPSAGENGAFGTDVFSLASSTTSTTTPANTLTLKAQ